jgi:hypothetical protein
MRSALFRYCTNPRGLAGRGGALSYVVRAWGFGLGALGLAACGPQAATPMPEPPSIDGGLIGPDREGISILMEPRPVPLVGSTGAVTPGALVRVLNLDAGSPADTVVAAADGSFQLSVLASNGDELRFSAVLEGRRSAPVDFIYTSDFGDDLTASPRHACVTLQPGLELELASSRASVPFQNACSGPIQLASPRFRTGADFALITALPLVVGAGESGAVELELRNAPPPAREDVWFTDVTLGSTALRYPIGVFAEE